MAKKKFRIPGLRVQPQPPNVPCMRCGRGVEEDEKALYQLTRIDPHTKLERPVTPEEMEFIRGKSFQETRPLGYMVGVMCTTCAQEYPSQMAAMKDDDDA